MLTLITHNVEFSISVKKPMMKLSVFLLVLFSADQLKKAECQSEAAKQRELQKKIEQLKAEISHLDSQISGTEEQLATQG